MTVISTLQPPTRSTKKMSEKSLNYFLLLRFHQRYWYCFLSEWWSESEQTCVVQKRQGRLQTVWPLASLPVCRELYTLPQLPRNPWWVWIPGFLGSDTTSGSLSGLHCLSLITGIWMLQKKKNHVFRKAKLEACIWEKSEIAFFKKGKTLSINLSIELYGILNFNINVHQGKDHKSSMFDQNLNS